MPIFLDSVDFDQNEWKRAVVENLSTPPSSPISGQIYFNTSDNRLYIYDGAEFVSLSEDPKTPVVFVNSNYSISEDNRYIFANASSGMVVITLPSAASVTGNFFTVKKIDSSPNVVRVVRSGSDMIDGDTQLDIGVFGASISFISDGNNWHLG